MEQFDLEEYLKNPSRKVVTRIGSPVKIHCTNFNSPQPVVAEIENLGYSTTFFENGRYSRLADSSHDLFFADSETPDTPETPEIHVGWINLYRGTFCELYIKDFRTFESKEDAEKNAKNDRNYAKSVKIKWEE